MKAPCARQTCLRALCATLILALGGCITPIPRVAPPPGIYACPQTVTITDARAGAAIFYTTDGSTPTPSSTEYTGPFAVGGTDKVQAIALAPGAKTSTIAAVSYTCKFTRADFAVMLQQRFALVPPKEPVVFPDVQPADSIYNAVEAAEPYMNPLVLCHGCSLTRNFFPREPVTRAIMTITLVRILAASGKLQILSAAESDSVLSKSSDAKILPPLARQYFATAIGHGIISFLPGDRIEPSLTNTQPEITGLLDRLQTEFKFGEGTRK